jgi:hypothetical protein
MSGVGSSAHDSLGELVMGSGEGSMMRAFCLAGFLRLGQHAKHSPRFARQGSFSGFNVGRGPWAPPPPVCPES